MEADSATDTTAGKSEAAVPPPAPGGAPGNILKKTREARGESLADVVKALKLSPQQIEAIESGRFESLPGPLFVRGFLRNYARHLGLDPQALLADFDQGATVATVPGSTLDTRDHAVFDEQAGASVKPRASLLPLFLVMASLLALLGAGIFFGWFEAWLEPESATVTQRDIGSSAISPSWPEPESAAVTQPPDPSKPESTAPGSGQAPYAAAIPAPATPATKLPAAAAESQVSTLSFILTARAWIKVSETGSSGFLVNRTYDPGSAPLRVKGKPPFSLSITNANKVKLEFDGKPVDLRPHTNREKNTASLTLQ
ncbi:MAG: DUF4115 domain-containing protein [Azoarcus sp.]|jgi:cytoskeleton protein RodZ|nr:DUF4115 domain-containing protein [Azoarcus sp.]